MNERDFIKMLGDPDVLKAMGNLAQLGMMGQVQKHDAPTTVTAPYIHGPGGTGAWSGLLSYPGVTPDMVSAIMGSPSIADFLYRGVSIYDRLNLETFTGITQTDGDCAENSCEEYPTVGNPKTCLLTFRFGEIMVSTPVRKFSELGTRVDLSETDRVAINLAMQMNRVTPQLMAGVDINNQLFWDVYSLGHNVKNVMEQIMFQGDATTAPCEGDWANQGITREWHGFDVLINTGIIDAQQEVACPAADSIVADFDGNDICDLTADPNIVDLVSNIWWQLTTLAGNGDQGVGMIPAAWIIGMHPYLFKRATECWPCSYLTNQCQVEDTTTGRVTVAGNEQVAMRDDMFNNRFLWVLGNKVPVFTSYGPANTQEGDGFNSSIYFINTMGKGRPMTWLEGQNMDAQGEATQYGSLLGFDPQMRTTNGGFWQVTITTTKDCVQLHFHAKPRLITQSTFLNARIDDIHYSLPGYARSPLWDDPYYADGGRPRRPTPSLTDPWSLT